MPPLIIYNNLDLAFELFEYFKTEVEKSDLNNEKIDHYIDSALNKVYLRNDFNLIDKISEISKFYLKYSLLQGLGSYEDIEYLSHFKEAYIEKGLLNDTTPLNFAIFHEKYYSAKLFLDWGIPPNNPNIETEEPSGTDPFYRVIKWDERSFMLLLLSYGEKISIEDSAILLKRYINKARDFLDFLVDNGYLHINNDVAQIILIEDLYKRSFGPKPEVVTYLNNLGFYPDINRIIDGAETYLHLAINRGDLEMVKYYISLGIDLNMVNLWGETPLETSLKTKNKDIIEVITKALN